jgi:uncharacterized protein (TIGR03435 family)
VKKSGTVTKKTALAGILVLALFAAAILIKAIFFPSVKDAYFAMNDRSLLHAPANLVVVRATHYSFLRRNSGINEAWPPNREKEWRAMGRNVSLRRVISEAYGQDALRVVLPPDAPTNNFDFLVTVLTNQQQQLQVAIRKRLGYAAHKEIRDTKVLALEIKSPDLPGLKISTSSKWSIPWGRLVHFHVGYLAWQLEGRLQQPVINETGLTNFYDFDWDFTPHDRATLDKMLAHLGLGLESKTEPVEVLVVEKGR